MAEKLDADAFGKAIGIVIKRFPNDVKIALKDSGVDISSNPSQRELLDAIFANAPKNKKLVQELSTILFIRQKEDQSKNSNAGGLFNFDVSDSLKTVGGFFGIETAGDKANRDAQTQIALAKIAAEKEVGLAQSAKNAVKKMPVWGWVAIGVGTLGLIYLIVKKPSGGSIVSAPVAAPVAPAPIAPAPVV